MAFLDTFVLPNGKFTYKNLLPDNKKKRPAFFTDLFTKAKLRTHKRSCYSHCIEKNLNMTDWSEYFVKKYESTGFKSKNKYDQTMSLFLSKLTPASNTALKSLFITMEEEVKLAYYQAKSQKVKKHPRPRPGSTALINQVD